MKKTAALLILLLLCAQARAGTMTLLGVGGSATAPICDAWVPRASGVEANVAADFSTEGSSNHYWYNSTCYGSAAAWLTALGATQSRASSAYYTNSSKLLASAATNVLRFNYNPATGAALGMLIEAPATNLALWSRDLTQVGTWVAVNVTTALTATGADGSANSATTLTSTAANATVLQTPGLASAARTYSVYACRNSGSGTFKITNDGSTFSTDLSGSLSSCPTFSRATQSQTAVPIIGIQIGTSGDSFSVDFNQLEDTAGNSTPTTPILTTSATATRAEDILTWPLPFTAFSTTTGSVASSYATAFATPTNSGGFVFSDGTVSNRIGQAPNANTGGNALNVRSGAVNQAVLTVTGLLTAAFSLNKTGIVWATNDFAVVANAGTPTTTASGTVPTGLNQIKVGGLNPSLAATGSTNWATWNYWASRVSNADLQTLTGP